jgi:peptidylprolyl isomerase
MTIPAFDARFVDNAGLLTGDDGGDISCPGNRMAICGLKRHECREGLVTASLQYEGVLTILDRSFLGERRRGMKGKRKFIAKAGLSVLALSLVSLIHCAAKKYPDGLYAEVTTNKGLIVMQLEFKKTPMTAANFVGLAEGTIKNAAFPEGTPYFNGTKFHRVAPGHVIQCGIPKGSDQQGPGYEFPNEIRPDLSHGRAGMVNMANSGPHTNGSQWCIMLGDRSYLDGDYTVFGHVVQGMEVVFSIVQGDEIQAVKIVRVGQAARKFRPTDESFRKMVEEANVRVKEAEDTKKLEEEETIRKNWPDSKILENGLRYIIVREGKGKALAAGAKIQVVYTGKSLHGLSFTSTADEGKPAFGDRGEPFEYEVGKSHVTPGFDAAVAQMKKGEKRILIVPAELGYGIPGFYAKEKKGEKRFHISPNTILVYEVDVLEF